MSIFIKGMEMPQTCDECFLPLQLCDYAMKPNGKCPLIELPPHGRLVDIESVRAKARDVMLANGAKHRCIDATALYEIPIIIEAEGG